MAFLFYNPLKITDRMANLYLNQSPNKKVENVRPSKETIAFLLNYSKALSVIDYKKMKFEALLN